MDSTLPAFFLKIISKPQDGLCHRTQPDKARSSPAAAGPVREPMEVAISRDPRSPDCAPGNFKITENVRIRPDCRLHLKK